jgi:glutamine synthetase type III
MYLLQAEVSGFSVFKEPIALGIAVLGAVLLAAAKITLPEYIKKKAETEVKKIESGERIVIEENNQIVEKMGNLMNRFEESINELKDNTNNLTKITGEQAKSIARMSRQIDPLVVVNENLEIMDRLMAFNWCLKGGKNGIVFDKGCELVLHNKTKWLWILEHDQYKQPQNKEYQKLLKKVEKRVLI